MLIVGTVIPVSIIIATGGFSGAEWWQTGSYLVILPLADRRGSQAVAASPRFERKGPWSGGLTRGSAADSPLRFASGLAADPPPVRPHEAMKLAKVPNPRATLALGVFFLVANMVAMVYAVRRVEPSGSFLLLDHLGAGLVVAYWIMSDSRRLGLPASVDQGWFLISAWPICAFRITCLRRGGGRVASRLRGSLGCTPSRTASAFSFSMGCVWRGVAHERVA